MILLFADGTAFAGTSFGARRSVRGEVVFHTGMVGYVEALTDPSYRGQILALTYPLQGNYGVPAGPFESASIQVQGLIVHRHAALASHRTSELSLADWLCRHDVPAIEGVDTRRLTRYLRERGTLEGRLLADGDEQERDSDRAGDQDHVDMRHVLDLVAPSQVAEFAGGDLRVLLIDTGAKDSIARCLNAEGATVVRVPWSDPWERRLGEVDGVVLANGPGDPRRLAESESLQRVQEALRRELPTLGICLGHQWLAQAAGAAIYKLPYGHRSHNQPVIDRTTGRAYLTTQNHGYAVDATTLDAGFEPWFANLNDQSNEGLRHRDKPFRSVQFHPEASAGPRDTRFVFREFLRMAGESRVARRVPSSR